MSTANIPQKSEPAPDPSHLKVQSEPEVVARRHLVFGWWTLLVFLTMGMVLEVLHGFKVGAYLKVSNETRRLMWTLAHAHGTLLSLVNLAFGFMVPLVPGWASRSRAVASFCLRGATWLMPVGFFLGGLYVYSGDPGLGILLVPVGGIMLFIAVFLAARSAALLRSVPRPAAPAPGRRK